MQRANLNQKSTIERKILLQPNTLGQIVKKRTEEALSSGALLPIPTDSEFLQEGGVRFIVKTVSNLARKDKVKKQETQIKKSSQDFNPFLPYEENLLVSEITGTHVCIFNKFNVVDYHLLIITRAFEEQESLLSLEDFIAAWLCLADFDGLLFYNGGKNAGASQRHKHLQLIPLPLIPGEMGIPISPLLSCAAFNGAVGTIKALPFQQAIAKLDASLPPLQAGEAAFECYSTLLEALDIRETNDKKPSNAYNLLATREWMFLIPRSVEEFSGISVNSLGFAGSLFVRNAEEMQILKKFGPMNILRNVAVSVQF
jgi:sulfate adenylyltransferase (ADP) / ATP adenylyltransferase